MMRLGSCLFLLMLISACGANPDKAIVRITYKNTQPQASTLSSSPNYYTKSSGAAGLVADRGPEKTFCYFINVRAPDLNIPSTSLNSCSSNNEARRTWGYITPKAFSLGSVAEFEVPQGTGRQIDILGFKNPDPGDDCSKTLKIIGSNLYYNNTLLSEHKSGTHWHLSHNEFAAEANEIFIFAQTDVFTVSSGVNEVEASAIEWKTFGNSIVSEDNKKFPTPYSCTDHQVDILDPVKATLYEVDETLINESTPAPAPAHVFSGGDFYDGGDLNYKIACDNSSRPEIVEVSGLISEYGPCEGEKRTVKIKILGLVPSQTINISFKFINKKASGRTSDPYEVIFLGSTTGSEDFIPYCPPNYLYVSENAELDTVGFCVAKFEMKAAPGSFQKVEDIYTNALYNNGNGNFAYTSSPIPVPRPEGTPWVNLTQRQAILSCDRLNGVWGYDNYTGPYRLISNRQWQAVAESISNNPNNIHLNQLDQETLAVGNSDTTNNVTILDTHHIAGGIPLSLNLSALRFGVGASWGFDDNVQEFQIGGFRGYSPSIDSTRPEDKKYRRTFYLGGEVIWDFAGNASEWVMFNEIDIKDNDWVPTNYNANTNYSIDSNLSGPGFTNNTSTFNSRNFLLKSSINNNYTYEWNDELVNAAETSSERGFVAKYFRPLDWELSYGKLFIEKNIAVAHILRGGGYGTPGTDAGIYQTSLVDRNSSNKPYRGFRCVFEPSRMAPSP